MINNSFLLLTTDQAGNICQKPEYKQNKKRADLKRPALEKYFLIKKLTRA